MLRRLDRLAVRAGRMATVSLVLLDPRTGALRHASAGHLPPLLVEPDGAVRFLRGGAAPPLLAFDRATSSPAATVLAPGARLLLYTDGLVERRTESIDAASSRLAEWPSAGRSPASSPTWSPRCCRRRASCATTSRSLRCSANTDPDDSLSLRPRS